MSIKCESCRFWNFVDDFDESGYRVAHCCRFPPQMTRTPRSDIGINCDDSSFPVTVEDDWCGEWAPNAAVLKGREKNE